jgi:hypothetical protein
MSLYYTPAFPKDEDFRLPSSLTTGLPRWINEPSKTTVSTDDVSHAVLGVKQLIMFSVARVTNKAQSVTRPDTRFSII